MQPLTDSTIKLNKPIKTSVQIKKKVRIAANTKDKLIKYMQLIPCV